MKRTSGVVRKTAMLRRRRKRAGLKDVHAYVRIETYLYISELAGDEGSMGLALDKLAREHAQLLRERNAPATLP